MRGIYICFILTFILSACASSTQKRSGRKLRNVITAEEIARTNARNAYEAIQNLRPQLLNFRGKEPSVFVDNLKQQAGVAALQSIFVLNIAEIKYLDQNEATWRFGTGNPGGAFVITTKKN